MSRKSPKSESQESPRLTELTVIAADLVSADGRDLHVEARLLRCLFGESVSDWPAGLASLGFAPMESFDGVLRLIALTLPGWRWVAHSPRQGLAYGATVSDPRQGGLVVPAEHPSSGALVLLLALVKTHIELEKSCLSGLGR